jgi:hypothetical protein
MTSTAIVGDPEGGLSVHGQGSTAIVRDSVLRDAGTALPDAPFGLGAMVREGATLSLTSSSVRGSVGIGLVFAAGSGSVDGVFVVDNRIGIQVQDGSILSEVSRIPDVVGPLEVMVAQTSQFIGNDARVGSGVIPLPQPIP